MHDKPLPFQRAYLLCCCSVNNAAAVRGALECIIQRGLSGLAPLPLKSCHRTREAKAPNKNKKQNKFTGPSAPSGTNKNVIKGEMRTRGGGVRRRKHTHTHTSTLIPAKNANASLLVVVAILMPRESKIHSFFSSSSPHYGICHVQLQLS